LGKIKKAKLSLWSLLKEGEVKHLEDDTLTVEFLNGRSFHKRQAERRENFNLIQRTLGEVFDQPFGLKFELNESKMPSGGKQENSKSDNRSSQAVDDPLVKSIMDTFEGEII
jgi:5-carboxymethyl-2-hydroxymuconate isomerase